MAQALRHDVVGPAYQLCMVPLDGSLLWWPGSLCRQRLLVQMLSARHRCGILRYRSAAQLLPSKPQLDAAARDGAQLET